MSGKNTTFFPIFCNGKFQKTKKGTFDRAFFVSENLGYLTMTFSTLAVPWAVTFTI